MGLIYTCFWWDGDSENSRGKKPNPFFPRNEICGFFFMEEGRGGVIE